MRAHAGVSTAGGSDLEEIGDWIATGNPVRAITFIQQIRQEFERIAQHPLAYRLRPEIGTDLRLALVGRYVVLFWISGENIRIERVLFGGRNLPKLMDQ